MTIIWNIWMFRDSQPGENQWGPNPKGQTEVLFTEQNIDTTKDQTIRVNEDKLVIDDAVYRLESHVAFGNYNGMCQLDAVEPVANGAEPSYFFHADIEKRTFNTTINFPGGEWIFCHFRFKSLDLEFGPENFISGTLIITKDDSSFSLKGDGELDTGQSVSFYFNVPTENYSNMGKTE